MIFLFAEMNWAYNLQLNFLTTLHLFPKNANVIVKKFHCKKKLQIILLKKSTVISISK